MKSKTTTSKSTQSPRRQTLSGQLIPTLNTNLIPTLNTSLIPTLNTNLIPTLNTNRTNIFNKLDSVAQVNVIPENQIEILQIKLRITKSTITLSAYNRSNIPVKGKNTLDIQHGGIRTFLCYLLQHMRILHPS